MDEIEISGRRNARMPVSAPDLPEGLTIHVRSVPSEKGTLVTLTVVNEMSPAAEGRDEAEQITMFQVGMDVTAAMGSQLVPKPEVLRAGDEEEEAAALLYRDARAFAVGHTCSATWVPGETPDIAASVSVSWLPRYEVPKVHSGGHEVFAGLQASPEAPCLEAQWLSEADAEQLEHALHRLVDCYSDWIQLEYDRVPGLPEHFQETARSNLERCKQARDRMDRGAKRIVNDGHLRRSFQLANRAIQIQHSWNPERKEMGPFTWRPFQLAFVLVTAPSVCEHEDPDRGIMDLLWFPTGGGKTEAYLALIAMLAFHRRLSQPAEKAIGVAAVMRYTLRLLTTQQFVRASALILACDLIRRGDKDFGSVPFSIGLWLGGDATPNRFEDAVKALEGDRKQASPEQLTECPCCRSRLVWSACKEIARIEVHCNEAGCDIGSGGKAPLPVWTVDDDVYRERPTLLIGTIDKFAQLPRKSIVKDFFRMGSESSPDLVIQDELHLISGPLGTIAAVYEVAFDWLIAKGSHRCKVIGSTATIRRAVDQTRALFNREAMQFPPPGLDQSDSGFAVLDEKSPGRLYVGVTTAGRSAKFTLQAVTGCLMQSAFGGIADPKLRDPYATLVAYFNSLRELGGALVLMQDDVHDSLKLYANKHGENRRPAGNIEELTSRRTQEEVRDMLDKLATRATEEGCVDVVLATNMLSVGVDVPRLGLMLVNGQPKTRSEYIQATSRVGRDKAPGLVVVLLNNAKPRDRSHYETFPIWHASLYRDVEATSVTPFASRARDRALHAALVSMIRHGVPVMAGSPVLNDAGVAGSQIVVDEIVQRATDIDPLERNVLRELKHKLIEWEARNPRAYWNDRQANRSLLQSFERAAALRALGRGIGEAWPTMNNMRSVEPSVPFRLAEALRSHNSEPNDTEVD